MEAEFDLCIIGSGAGGAPIAYSLAKAGKSVLVLEKGPWVKEEDFSKDEITYCRRDHYTPRLEDEPQVIEDLEKKEWVATSNAKSGWSLWNGSLVGGSSNFMSGFFHRAKPVDFRLLSEFGPIPGANIADWPVSYDDLEPFYRLTEELIGVSGRVVQHSQLEPRSTKDFPLPPLQDHPLAAWIDEACAQLGYHPFPTPRAILTAPQDGRAPCVYSRFCGSYGCSTGAKGSARAALIDQALKTGRCEVRPHSKVFALTSDSSGRVSHARYYDRVGLERTVSARAFVVACQAIESSRLLLLSTGPKHPKGLGNRHDQVGKNLIFSAGGVGWGDFHHKDLDPERIKQLQVEGPFVNRALQDWYVFKHPELGRVKGGTIDFLHEHPNPIRRAAKLYRDENGKLLWGEALQEKLHYFFTKTRRLRFEVFNDWLPNPNCFVTLDPEVKDRWGIPVAKVRVGYHRHDVQIGRYLAEKATAVLKRMGARDISTSIGGSPPANLQGGGCRFGTDPKTSVLDPECRVHGAENVFVTDGSFMPTGGSVTYTWTIYANSLRVAKIVEKYL